MISFDSMCTHVTINTVEEELNAGTTPVLLACLHPDAEMSAQVAMLEDIAIAYGQRVKVCLLRDDLNGAFGKTYAIEGTPTYLLFTDQTVRERVLGLVEKPTLTRLLDQSLEHAFALCREDRIEAELRPSHHMAGLKAPGMRI